MRSKAPSALGAVLAAVAVLSACGTTVPQAALGGPGPASPGSADARALGLGPGLAPTGNSAGAGTAPGAAPPAGGALPGPTAGAPTAAGNGNLPPGVGPAAADRAPLLIGVTYTNNDATSAALGVSSNSAITKKAWVQALVRGINAAGGVAGRQLRTVDYEWNSSSNDWSSDAAAACARFTQDNHVTVVLDNSFGTIGGFRDCLQKAGLADLESGPEGDRVSSAAARLHANTFAMTTDRNYAAVLEGLARTGYLSKANQLGVILENCPDTARAYSRTIKPMMARLGLKPPKEAVGSCTTGFASAGPAASTVNNAILMFRTAGVDRVMFVSDNESVVAYLFAPDADSQGYHPGYALSSGADAQYLRTQVPSGQQAQLHGVGSLPFNDVDGATLTTVDRRCLQLAKVGGAVPVNYLDYGTMLFECGPLLLLDAALQASHGRSDAAALVSAIAGLGTSFAAPGVLDQSAWYSSTVHDGPAAVQTFDFVASCGCMRYSGTARPAPS